MLRKILILTVIPCFLLSTFTILPQAHAESLLDLPAPGSMINLSPVFKPTLIKGLTIHKDNPFLFDFILDTGNSHISGENLKKEGDRLVKYFFACLTIPEKELWVNLSPYEKNRMIPNALGQTALGRDLLAEDYILKQLTASLIYPEKDLGKSFWDRVYARARQMYGTTQIPVNTFNKVWILADKASVYEHGQTAFVINGHLKVMLEQDYLSLEKHGTKGVLPLSSQNGVASVGANILRTIILPEIEKEVNTGKNFAALRQIFNSLILASWYKKSLKEALLNQVYANKSTVKGVNLADPSLKEKIYQQYLMAYKKGVFSYIKEDAQANGKAVTRKYFSGGFGSRLDLTVDRNPADALSVAGSTGDVFDLAVGINVNGSFNNAMISAKKEVQLTLPKHKQIPGFKNVKKGEVFLGKWEKLYPLTIQFLQYYGGDKKEYSLLKELAKFMFDNNVDIHISSKTIDPYVDIDVNAKSITINSDFMEFLFKTGRKKVYMSLIAGAILRLRDGVSVDTNALEVLLAGGKKSLVSANQTRLDDTKKLYQLKRDIEANDADLQHAQNPRFLNENDVLLIISDVLQRGRILDARRLFEYLKKEFGHYGVRDINKEKAGEILAEFQAKQSGIIRVRETTLTQDDAKSKRRLEPAARIIGSDDQGVGAVTKSLTYSVKADYMKDPAFKDRYTIWDIEVERQDEVGFGGKVAHTGEMMFVPSIVTMPNFSSSGSTFQKLFEFNEIAGYQRNLVDRRYKIKDFMGKYGSQLSVEPSELDPVIEHELNALRIVIEDNGGAVIDQIKRTTDALDQLITDLKGGNYSTLKDYFIQQGQKLDAEVVEIKKQKNALIVELTRLNLEIKALTDKKEDASFKQARVAEINSELDQLQRKFEGLSASTANRLLVAARFLQVDPVITEEIKTNLRILAQRIGVPLEKLVLAIRSSAVGEDSEEASFAGRQDTYIFQRPIATSGDPEGLDNIIVSWIFNQASLFNKRAIDYRMDQGLPTFDEHVEISTLFQQMFLSQKSFIGFSVDRESGAAVMSMTITEGQGELLVSGQESGSKFLTSYDGRLLVRQKGERVYRVVETEDGLGKTKERIPDEVRQEFAITDHRLLEASAKYFKFLHDYYEGFVDLEGAYRVQEDAQGNPIYLTDDEGKILTDERGFPRMSWAIASTQVRPETVFSAKDQDIVPLRRIVVTEASYQKALREGRVLSLSFIAKTKGAAQGKVVWIDDKTPESLAQARDRIMLTEQSDPDMTSAMLEARGIIALKGGANSHTMIVAGEYDLVAMTGIDGISMEDLKKLLPSGTEITIDAERGKILLGTDYEFAFAGKDFNVRDIPDTKEGDIRSSTIVASVGKAFGQSALSKIPSYKGIGLLRLELALSEIGIYPEYLLAYDNLMKKRRGGHFTGPVLDPVADAEGIAHVKKAISGYNSAEDFYTSILSEWVTAMAESLIPPQQEVIVWAQSISDPQLRLKVIDIVKHYYEIGLGHEEPLHDLQLLLTQEIEKAKTTVQHILPGSDIEKLTKVIGLVNKRLYIRMDDRKSDEYGAVFGAERFVRDERNPMKGYRGLDLMLRTPETLRWQLEALRKAAALRRSKMGVFAPVVRRPQDVVELLKIMDEVGLTKSLVKRGIMTELPTNGINIEDFLETGIDFISTGGNDGLQTIGRVDRNTSRDALKKVVTAYSDSVLRWNASIIKGIVRFFKRTGKHIDAGFCGNDPSIPGQENYGVILSKLGYDSVSVIIDAYQAVAKNLTRGDFEIPPQASEAVNYDLHIEPVSYQHAQKPDFETVDITQIRQQLGFHYRAIMDYVRILSLKPEVRNEQDEKIYQYMHTYLSVHGNGINADDPRQVLNFYRNLVMNAMEEAYQRAQAQNKKLVVALDNGFSDQYRQLALGKIYEPHEANSEYGYHGLVRVLDSDKDFLEFELSAIKEIQKRHGAQTVTILLRAVRNYTEIAKLREQLKAQEIENTPIAVDVEITANIYEIDRILNQGKISFISITDPRRLTSDMMALEQGNSNGLVITQVDIDYQLNRPVGVIATATQAAGVPFYLDSSVTPTPFKMDAAMAKVDKAVISTQPSKFTAPGGIDLNGGNMVIGITKDINGGVQINFDPAMIERIKKQGVFSVDPFIIHITSMNSTQILPLLGLQSPTQVETVRV